MNDRVELEDLQRPKPVIVGATGRAKAIHNDATTGQHEVINGRAVDRHQRQDKSTYNDVEAISPAVGLGSSGYSKNYDSKHSQGMTLQTNISEFPIRRETHHVEREIRRMLLLNAYPFMYVMLWIPGLANRLMEASGHSPSKDVMAALQVSTQFVGFANALTYGFNHHLRDRLKGLYAAHVLPRVKRNTRR